MTVETTTNTQVARGNGATTSWPFGFKVLDATHLVIQRRVFATGVIDKTYSLSEVTVTGIGDAAGGTVEITPALSNIYEVIISRTVPYKQELDIVNQGGFFPDTVEQQLDLMEMQTQQISDKADRAIIVPAGETGGSLPIKTLRANKFAAYDSAGDPSVADGAAPVPNTAANIIYNIDTAGYPANTVGKAIDRLRNTGLLLSEEYATLNDFFAAVEGMSGKKGGIISPGTWNVASEIDRSAVDWSGVTIVGLPGLSKINSTGSYGVLKLGNLDRVLIEGVGFTSSYVNAVEDTGAALLYSFQKSVLRSAIRRCYFNNPLSFTSAITFYARTTTIDTSGTIDGIEISDNFFENVGRICITLMNRNPDKTGMRRIVLADNRVKRSGAQAPAFTTAGGACLSGMFVSFDGYGYSYDVLRNFLEAVQGIGIEVVGSHDNVRIHDTTFIDFSHGIYPLSIDNNGVYNVSHSRISIKRTRMVGDLTGAYQCSFKGMDNTCVLEDNDFYSHESQAAVAADASSFISRHNRIVNSNTAGQHALLVGSSRGPAAIDSDGDLFDGSATTAGFATIRFANASSAVGATTDAAGYAIGATVITLAAAGTGAIADGSVVSFAGDPNSYVASTGNANVAAGGTITLQAPGLLQAIPAAATAITVPQASGSLVMNATIRQGTGGNIFDQVTGASGNFIGPYIDKNGVKQGQYLSYDMPNADTTLSGTNAMILFEGIRLVSTAWTAQRVLTFPDKGQLRFGMSIRNDKAFPAQIKVGSTSGELIYPGTRGQIIYDSSLGSARSFAPNTPGAATGAINTTTDASGDVTVTHGLGRTPVNVQVTASGTTFMVPQVNTVGSTTFKVRFFDAAGAALATTAVTGYWEAR